jgi:hypothetical protein
LVQTVVYRGRGWGVQHPLPPKFRNFNKAESNSHSVHCPEINLLNTPRKKFLVAPLGTEKFTAEIANSFTVKELGRKVRSVISHCEICQKVKHPNWGCGTDVSSHMISRPGEICAVDLFEPLTVRRGGVRYILFCFEVFSRFIKLYPLPSSATIKSCLNKTSGHYITPARHPKCIFSSNEPQFTSPVWPIKLKELGIETQFAPLGHPQSNLSECRMKEIGKLCKTDCQQPHKNGQ